MNAQYFRILEEINDERNRQDMLKQKGKFARTCADDMTLAERVAVLAEEYGEVAHEVNETIGGHAPLNIGALRAELRQVGAVSLACLEGTTPKQGRWERLEEIAEEEDRCRHIGMFLPHNLIDNLDRFECFSGHYARAWATHLDARELRRLAAACMVWIAALEDDQLRDAQK
jgi:hypothetical protein